MTLANIMKLALRQLDEAAEDIAEYDELFRSYANMGYMIALRLFLRPRETFELTTDDQGRADIGQRKSAEFCHIQLAMSIVSDDSTYHH